jgi:hypothetical protein
MVEVTAPSKAARQGALTCPKCGAPLPLFGDTGYFTCVYCGVSTKVTDLIPAVQTSLPPKDPGLSWEPPFDSTKDYDKPQGPSYRTRAVIAVVVIAIFVAIGVYASSQNPSNAGVPSVAHCSVSISPSATTGPAPFTASFTAEITLPAGDSASEPMWQFGPFGGGFDLNYTYGTTVNHTWNTEGSFGVHVSVPDSSGQGCWATMSVNVT